MESNLKYKKGLYDLKVNKSQNIYKMKKTQLKLKTSPQSSSAYSLRTARALEAAQKNN